MADSVDRYLYMYCHESIHTLQNTPALWNMNIPLLSHKIVKEIE